MFRRIYADFARDYKGEYRAKRKQERKPRAGLSNGIENTLEEKTYAQRINQKVKARSNVRKYQITIRKFNPSAVPPSRGYQRVNRQTGYRWLTKPDLVSDISRKDNALKLLGKPVEIPSTPNIPITAKKGLSRVNKGLIGLGGTALLGAGYLGYRRYKKNKQLK